MHSPGERLSSIPEEDKAIDRESARIRKRYLPDDDRAIFLKTTDSLPEDNRAVYQKMTEQSPRGRQSSPPEDDRAVSQRTAE